MALVVGGTYQGTTQYYRIDFIDTESGELINVLRNHLYQFSIADVVGPGQPDPQAAYENHSMNIEVNVVGWETEVFEDVKIVRDRYFSLSRRTPFEMPPLGAQTETLTIETNIESFTMTLASAPAITLSSGTGGTLSTSDFRYILAGNNGAYTLTVETLADNLGNPQRVPFDTWAVDADGIIEFEYRVEQEWSEFNPAPHDITLTPGEGGTAASGRDSAPQGTPVRVWARSSQGYVFSGWTLTTGPDGFTLPAGQLSSPEMTFTMPGGAVSIAAFFAEATLTAVIDNAAPWNAHEQYSTGQEQPAEGATGPRTITVTANTPWTATLSDNDNFALGGTTSGSTDGSFTVFPTTPNAADTDSTRQVTVTVSAAGMARTIVLTHSSIADKEFDFTGEPDDWTDKDLEQAL